MQQSGGLASFADYYIAKYDSVILDHTLKKKIIFAEHNLVTDGVFGEMHVVICRNVLIYFNRELQTKVFKLFYSYYLEEHKKGMEKVSAGVVAPSMAAKEIKKKVASQPPKINNLAKKLEHLEEEIDQYERKIKLIDGEMVAFSLDANRLNELFQEKEVLDKKLDKCLDQWEAFQE